MSTYITGAELTTYASARGITLTDDPAQLVDVIETEIEYIDQGQEAVVSQKITRAASGLISAANNGIRFAVFNG